MTSAPRKRSSVAVLLLFACGPAIASSSEEDDADSESVGSSAGTDAPSTTTDGTTTAAEGEAESTEPGTTSSASSSSSSTTDIDVPPGFIPGTEGDWGPCDPWVQDCPPGEKCTWWAENGDYWDATRCVPVAPDPDRLAESCTAEEWLSGIDSCDAGLICMDVDPESNMGTCAALCVGSESWPVCPHPDYTCRIYGSGVLPLCVLDCDPLLQDCPDGQGCYRFADTDDFMCGYMLSREGGSAGDPCSEDPFCQPGFFCAAAHTVPGCATDECCTYYCDLEAPQCPPDQECVAVFEPGQAPFGHDDVGRCEAP